jgi:hypothetical protein
MIEKDKIINKLKIAYLFTQPYNYSKLDPTKNNKKNQFTLSI